MKLGIKIVTGVIGLVCALTAPALAQAAAFVPAPLLSQATASPDSTFKVVVLGAQGTTATSLARETLPNAKRHANPARGGKSIGDAQRRFAFVDAVTAELTGSQVVALAALDGVRSITPDATVSRHSVTSGTMWQEETGISTLWGLPAPQAPTIAIVDSGVAGAPDFAGRVAGQFNFTQDSVGVTDTNGHGTMVAGIALGSSASYPGAAPNASVVSLRVVNDEGFAYVSDVIAAANWIYENADRYDIKVANFSLSSSSPAPAFADPLDAAVRRLWLSGIVVVASSGNHGPQPMVYSPGSDPFVITVGAVDINDTASRTDDFNPPWSSYGYTAEGFAKPEVSAPGRYMIARTPMDGYLAKHAPTRVVAPGYMWMSGTSFSAPVVAGLAAQILARHPDWTPDQVKGALMVTAHAVTLADPMSLGIGAVDASAASVANPPNPNQGLDAFVATDDDGQPTFDSDAWKAAVATDASWTDASWTDASWTDASWTDASWTNASWTDASWTDASWTDASWTDASWTDASWTDASWTN
jgi:serine protease AprX